MALQTCYKCRKQFPPSEISRITITKKTGRIGKQVGLEHNLKTRQKTVKIESSRNVYTDYEVLSCKNCKPIGLIYILYFICFGWMIWVLQKIYIPIFLLPFKLVKKILSLPFRSKKTKSSSKKK